MGIQHRRSTVGLTGNRSRQDCDRRAGWEAVLLWIGKGEEGTERDFPFPFFPFSLVPLTYGKYFLIVAAFGLVVANENPIIKSAEIITIGTTGMNPNTAVPPGVRVNT